MADRPVRGLPRYIIDDRFLCSAVTGRQGMLRLLRAAVGTEHLLFPTAVGLGA